MQSLIPYLLILHSVPLKQDLQVCIYVIEPSRREVRHFSEKLSQDRVQEDQDIYLDLHKVLFRNLSKTRDLLSRRLIICMR